MVDEKYEFSIGMKGPETDYYVQSPKATIDSLSGLGLIRLVSENLQEAFPKEVSITQHNSGWFERDIRAGIDELINLYKSNREKIYF